jgi:hypothetical protein
MAIIGGTVAGVGEERRRRPRGYDRAGWHVAVCWEGAVVGERKPIGLAVVGSGTIGRIRAELARQYPGVAWLGLCDLNEDVGRKLSEDTGADYFTTDHRELLALPEVTAAIIATDENARVGLDLPLEAYP